MASKSGDTFTGSSSLGGSDPSRQAEHNDTLDSHRRLIEEALTQIWAEVLGAEVTGIDANLFELGGDSLTATQIVARVREIFRVELPLRKIFEESTIAGLARALATAQRVQESPLSATAVQSSQHDGPLPLSLAQECIWFLQQLEPESTAYNVIDSARLTGLLNLVVLKRSLEAMVQRQAALRMTFPYFDGRQVQQIAPDFQPELHMVVVEVDGAEKGERERRALALATAEAHRSFDLARGPLWRLCLYHIDPEEHLFLLTMHHLISDGWSLTVILQELAAHYNAFVEGMTPTLHPLTIQYTDFAVWQRQWLQGQELEHQLSYWKRQLKGVSVLELPTDAPRPPIQKYHGTFQTRPLHDDLLENLKGLSAQEKVTLFMTLLAAIDLLLYRYTGQEDIAVGVPIANRKWVQVEGLIGTFVNTLVMRTDLSGSLTFRELLARVREVALEAYAHQDMPFAHLVAEMNPERDLSRTPLYQVMFNFDNVPLPHVRLHGIESKYVEVDSGGAQVDLTLTVTATRLRS